jgi:hypothetical protein
MVKTPEALDRYPWSGHSVLVGKVKRPWQEAAYRGEKADALIRSVCAGEGLDAQELRTGGQRRKASRVRAHLCYRLGRELGLSMAEIGRYLGVCTSAVFKAILCCLTMLDAMARPRPVPLVAAFG